MIGAVEPARCIVADPPWSFSDRCPGRGRGAAKHYSTMTTRDLCRLALPPIADDALLFLWRVAAMPGDALRVCEAWGFEGKSEIVWVKTSSSSAPLAASSRLAFGMGHYVRAAHEVCIIARRGRGAVANRSTRSVFFAPRGAHSAKPECFYDLVEQLAPGPHVELFARRQRPGWLCLGNEAPGAVTLAVGGSR